MSKRRAVTVLLSSILAGGSVARAQPKPKSTPGCGALPDHAKLRATLEEVIKQGARSRRGVAR